MIMMKKKRWMADEVEEFCGWDFLSKMILLCRKPRDRILITSAFLTGGRIVEILQLQKKHILFDQDPNYVVVRTMPMVKRYKKIRSADKWKCEGHCKMRWDAEPPLEVQRTHNIVKYAGWVTIPVKAYRTFPFPKSEPLVPVLADWIERLADPKTRLIRLSYQRAYEIVTAIGKELNTWIPTHWFRAQRASQLAFEYGFNEHDLVEFFKWLDYMTAFHYASKGYKGLATKMVR